VLEALDRLARDGVHLDYLRVRAFPFGREVQAFLDTHERVFVVEQNRDAQLKSLLLLETDVERSKLSSILHYNGLPIDCHSIEQAITRAIARGAAA